MGNKLPNRASQSIGLLLVFSFIVTTVAPVMAQEVEPSPQVSEGLILEESTNHLSVDSAKEDPLLKENSEVEKLPESSTPEDVEKDKKEIDGINTDSLLSNPVGEETPSTTNGFDKKIPQVSDFNGSMLYEFPVTVPPGRNNLQPDLKLVYSSESRDEGSVFAYGWNINIPYIERINRKGSEKLYSESYYQFSLGGELLHISGPNWKPKVLNNDFLNFSFSNNVWTVTDKKGVVYKFGTDVSERQDDQSDSDKIFKWMLQEVRDTNNNYIKYEYYKDEGQIYPFKIVYTGNDSTDGIFEVEFIRESRSDVSKSYKAAFLVTTRYRIKEIQIKVNNEWTRKFALGYTNADNTRRSLLDTITEIGRDDFSNTVTLPPTDYEYVKSSSGNSWVLDNSYSYPVRLVESAIADVNGDALPDILHSYRPFQQSVIKNTYINNGNGTWSINPNFEPPVTFFTDVIATNPRDMGVRLTDVNGDGLSDIIYHNSFESDAWINTGSGWSLDSAWKSPLPFAHGNGGLGKEYSAQLVDINGDGLVDIIRAYNDGSFFDDVYINNGSGWVEDTSWTFPVGLNEGVLIADLNNDGLNDLLQSYCGGYLCTPIRTAYINNGKGWVEDSNWAPPSEYSFTSQYSSKDEGTRIFDYNGDGFPDLVKSVEGPGAPPIINHTNTGYGWISGASNWNPPVPFGYTNYASDTGSRIVDIDGDGMQDLIRSYLNGGPLINTTHTNQKKRTDIIRKIYYPREGSAEITYKTSPKYRSGSTMLNSEVPFVLDTVESVTIDDGSGSLGTTTYIYEGGKYYYNTSFDKQFSGFNKITKVDPSGNKLNSYFHQGDGSDAPKGEYSDHQSKIGKLYRTEKLDSNGNLYSVQIKKWENVDMGNGVNFVKNIQTIEMTYDSNSSHRDKATTYVFNDTNGNLIQHTEWGEVSAQDDGTFTDIGTDKFTTNIIYATGSTLGVVGLLSDETTLNQSGSKVKQIRHYYDLLALGSVQKGNETKTEFWKSSNNYINTQRTYNSMGLVTQEKDSRGKNTNYSFDTYNLYPITITQPHSVVNHYQYDYSSGKIKQVTNPNGHVFKTIYDGLDRVIEEKQPDVTAPSALVTKEIYSFTDTVTAPVFDAQTTGNSGDVSNYTLSHTTSGSNRFLVVGVTADVDDRVVSVTYAGVSMTKLDNAVYAHGLSVWYLVNPSVGTNNVEINTDGNSRRMTVIVNSFNGVNQFSPINVHSATETGFGKADAHTVDSAVGDLVFSIISIRETGFGLGGMLRGEGQMQLSNVTGNSQTPNIVRLASSAKPGAVDKTVMSYSFGTDNFVLHYSFGIKPVGYPGSVEKTDYLNGSQSVKSYTYTDGLARVIQTRTQAEEANTYIIKDTIYDSRGFVAKESLPYFGTGSARTAPTTNQNLYISYTYDPLERVSTVTNAAGTTTNLYDDWKTTVIDSNNIPKHLYKDAYGNLIRVDEVNGANVYITNYQYNYLGNLTKITDALGNVRNFTYDGLGRRLTAEDLHASADSTFSKWTYTYDNDGNITKVVDGNGQTINYTYDDLSRVKTENFAGQTGTEVTYAYNGCPNGTGRLCNVTVLNGPVTTYEYDALGNIRKETRTIDSVPYVTLYEFDRLGNQILITNPDNSQVKYEYNSAGKIEKVLRKETGDTSFADVVTDFNYGPHDKVTEQVNANGTVTTNIYDANKLYRLSRKQTVTQSGSSGGGQTSEPVTVAFGAMQGDGAAYKEHYTWANARSAASGSASYSGSTHYIRVGKNGKNEYRIDRGFLAFDTSSLQDGAIITNAKIKLYVDSITNKDNDGSDWLTITQGLQASGDTLVKADYGSGVVLNNPTEGIDNTQRKDITDIALNQYLVFELNQTGWEWIEDNGVSKFSLREGHDVLDQLPDVGSAQNNSVRFRSVGYTGTNYDPVLEVTYVTEEGGGTSGPQTIQDLTYVYDNNGNVLSITDASETDTAKVTTYAYDDLNRLISASVTNAGNGDNTTKIYSYDAIGNITASSDSGVYTYAGHTGTNYANPHAVTGLGGATYEYDRNGNLDTDGTWTNTWDYQNRLIQSAKTGVNVTYAYDHSGQRVKQNNGTTTTVYPSRMYNTDGTTAQKHIFANDVLVATVRGSGEGANVSLDHTDHLTGTGVVTNDAGEMVQLLDYHPFGTFRVDWKAAGASDEQRKFAGHEHDVDTGLSYMNARYYNPATGKFTSIDPAYMLLGSGNFEKKYERKQELHLSNPQSLNSYSYGNNNPLLYRDDTGEILPFFAVGAVVWAVAEITLSAYDAYSTYKTVTNSNVSGKDKAKSVGYFALGVVGPGAGYKTAADKASQLTALSKYATQVKSKLDQGLIWTNRDRYRDSLQSAWGHWNDHKQDFPGLNSAVDYVKHAYNFVTNTPKGTLYRTLENGRDAYYNPNSNTLVITNQGVPATMFKPSGGLDYFNRLK